MLQHMATVSSQPDDVFALKEEQQTAQKAFLGGKDVSALLPTGFGESFAKQRLEYAAPCRGILHV